MVMPRAPMAKGVFFVALPEPDSSPDQLMDAVGAAARLADVTATLYAAAGELPVYWPLLLLASKLDAPGTQAFVPVMWKRWTAMVPFHPTLPPAVSPQVAAFTPEVKVPAETAVAGRVVLAGPVIDSVPASAAVAAASMAATAIPTATIARGLRPKIDRRLTTPSWGFHPATVLEVALAWNRAGGAGSRIGKEPVCSACGSRRCSRRIRERRRRRPL